MRDAPDVAGRHGRYRVAGKFMLRAHEDGIVTRLPTADEIARVRATLPDTRLRPLVEEGQRLAHLRLQDSYSFEIAEIFMGADDQKQLLANYRKSLELLDFRYEPLRVEAA